MNNNEKDNKQVGSNAEVPSFTRASQGYDMQQVDAYVDKVRLENDRLTDVNWQLFMFLSFEMEEIRQKNWELPETSVLYWDKINEIIEQPHDYKKLDNIIDEKKIDMDEPKKQLRAKTIVTGGIFYFSLVAIVLLVYLFGMTNPTGPPRNFMGFSVMTVVSRSMQDDIPQFSLVVTRRVDPATIRIGDDITYLRFNNTTVTHRVVGIEPNYSNTGLPGFETQGTMNPRPDTEIVPAANVIGRVVFSNLQMGRIVWFVQTNPLIVGAMLMLLIASAIILHKFVFPVIFQKKKVSNS